MGEDALEKKNVLRKKFGLQRLTMHEFVSLQEKVTEIQDQQKEKALAMSIEIDRTKMQEENENGRFSSRLFGNALKDTCESNYDCESPKICCDFGFKKMCCSGGIGVFDGRQQSRYGELAMVPVPIINPNPNK